MALTTWLKREGFGTYATVDEFAGELARRSTSALGALGAALQAPVEDLLEVAQGANLGVCVEVVRDLRVARGARLAALRAVLMAGAGAEVVRLFVGAADLISDPRLPAADRTYLLRSGLKGLIDKSAGLDVELARGMLGASELSGAGDKALIDEVLRGFPEQHPVARSVREAVKEGKLSAELEEAWLEVLARHHRAAKNAPAVARRLGKAPEWPPLVPASMRPLLTRAETWTPPAPKPAAPKTPEIAPSIQRRKAAAPPAEASPPPAPSAPREAPAIRSRGRRVEESPPQPIPPSQQEENPAGIEPRPRRVVSLKSLRFGEEVERIASRGTRAVERLMAAFDVRAELVGRAQALSELERAAAARGSREVNLPMLEELGAFAEHPKTLSAWRAAAEVVLRHLRPSGETSSLAG